MSENKVISIFSKQKPKALPIGPQPAMIQTLPEQTFEDVMQRNEEAKERQRAERMKANQSVLKSYRIKK